MDWTEQRPWGRFKNLLDTEYTKVKLLEVDPGEMEAVLRREGASIAVVMPGTVNYRTGEACDIPALVRAGHAAGCTVGFDLAHGAGNLELKLHDWNVDFAAWCSYKFLNGGPGAPGGVFVHERHHGNPSLPRLEGWWGHDKKRRFRMEPDFSAIPTAEAWQLSNPPILSMAALRASLELFDRVGMKSLLKTRELLTTTLERELRTLPRGFVEVLTPSDPARRGAALSLRVRGAKAMVDRLKRDGVLADFREPDVIRVAPVPLYNTVEDIIRFVAILRRYAEK
jgi:kynureninase